MDNYPKKTFNHKIARRQFLRFTGTGAVITVAAASCAKDPTRNVFNDHVDLGADDTALLNLSYAMEQLQAKFYAQVIASPYAGVTETEQNYFKDILGHQTAHKQILKSILAGNAIADLPLNFNQVNFDDRNSVLGAARYFEDLTVAGYNGIANMFKSAEYLLLIAKMVSVEARHAATIREVISPNSFVEQSVVDINGTSLEWAKTPLQILTTINKYLPSQKLTATTWGIYS